MNSRHRPMSALKMNVRELPYRIAIWKNNGKHEQAARALRILEESQREIQRRGGL